MEKLQIQIKNALTDKGRIKRTATTTLVTI